MINIKTRESNAPLINTNILFTESEESICQEAFVQSIKCSGLVDKRDLSLLNKKFQFVDANHFKLASLTVLVEQNQLLYCYVDYNA